MGGWSEKTSLTLGGGGKHALWATEEEHSKRDKGCRATLDVPSVFKEHKGGQWGWGRESDGKKDRNQDLDFGFYTK